MFAPIGEQVCDGSYIAFVMKKVNGPAQALPSGQSPLPHNLLLVNSPVSRIERNIQFEYVNARLA
jgi:hypothetical protein